MSTKITRDRLNTAHTSFLSPYWCYDILPFHSSSGARSHAVPNDLNELGTGVTATAETSVVRCVGFHPTKPHLVGGNYCAGQLLF